MDLPEPECPVNLGCRREDGHSRKDCVRRRGVIGIHRGGGSGEGDGMGDRMCPKRWRHKGTFRRCTDCMDRHVP